MATYYSPGFRNVEAESPAEAARIFANRQARRDFGRRGYCRTLRLDCWTENHRSHTFEAFIGYDVDRNSCSGHNVWIYVDRVGEMEAV